MAGEKGHQPSEEEVKKAKEMMTKEEKEMREKRREAHITAETENRLRSDDELYEEGAHYASDGRLEVTNEQRINAKSEMIMDLAWKEMEKKISKLGLRPSETVVRVFHKNGITTEGQYAGLSGNYPPGIFVHETRLEHPTSIPAGDIEDIEVVE